MRREESEEQRLKSSASFRADSPVVKYALWPPYFQSQSGTDRLRIATEVNIII